MTQRSRLHQTNTSASKSKGPKLDSNFLPTLLYDDLENTRKSVGLVHPFVLESLLEDTRRSLKHSNKKATLNTLQKSSKNADASEGEEDSKLGATSNRRKSTKTVFVDYEENIPDYFLVGGKSSTRTRTPDQYSSKTVNNQLKSKESSTYKTKNTIPRKQDTLYSEEVIAKTKLNTKKDVVPPTRQLRSSRQDVKPVRERKSISDLSIENMNWYYEDEDYYKDMCDDIMSDFAVPKGSNAARAYTYLLLDARICKNKRNISWLDFIDAIFYIGKGTGNRAFQHAKDTEKWLTDKKSTGSRNKKFLMIKEIWDSGNPIKVLLVTEGIIDNEAFTREAAMINAIGLPRLCNLKSGSYYGKAETLRARERFELGATLLVEARDIFKWKEATDVYPRMKLGNASVGGPNLTAIAQMMKTTCAMATVDRTT